MSVETLEQQARDALLRIGEHHAALRAAPDRRARWLRAVASLASAVADFAALAAEPIDDLLVAGAIGDSMLSACADDALHTVVEAQGEIAPLNLRQEWSDYGEALASGDSDGEDGQRLLVALAKRLDATYGA